jgi:hypothetical protein
MSSQPRLTDSPWFWIYLFGVAALLAVFLLGQKADDVQAQRDGNFTRRQLSLERQAGHAAPVADTDETEPRYVDFKIFYALIGSITVIAWIMHWRQFLQQRRAISRPVGQGLP